MNSGEKKKFVVNFTEYKSITNLTAFVPRLNSMPILKYVMMTVKGGSLKLSATDLEATIIYDIPVKSDHDFNFLVEVKFLLNIIKNHKKSDIEIYPGEDKDVLFIADGITYKYDASADIGQFPLIPEIKEKDDVRDIDHLQFCKVISNAIKFVSKEINRPIFQGVLFNRNNRKTYAVATDGKKIFEEKFSFKLDKTIKDVIISADTFVKFLRFKKVKSAVKFYLDKHIVVFKMDNVTIISHLIEGRYPDYRKAMPNNPKDVYTNFKFKKSLFVDTSIAMKDFVSKETFKVKHSYAYNSLEISAVKLGESTLSRKLEIVNNKKTVSEYAINNNFFLICLSAFEKDEEISMRISKLNENGHNNIPLVLSANNKRILLMPLRMV